MDQSDVSFANKMCDLAESGLDFTSFTKTALSDFLGESPSEVLFVCVGKAAIRRPDMFAKSLRRIFGEGAGPILRELEERADEHIRNKSTSEVPLLEELAAQIRGSGAAHQVGVPTYLHDHRLRDSWDELLEKRNATEQQGFHRSSDAVSYRRPFSLGRSLNRRSQGCPGRPRQASGLGIRLRGPSRPWRRGAQSCLSNSSGRRTGRQ